jgi:hypothetical protein
MSARMKETWKIENLESSRKHLIDHPLTSQFSLHSDPHKISPTWNKVSTTPWQGRSDLTGGYGRRIMKSSISCDAPTNFLNPERTTNAQKYDPAKMKMKIALQFMRRFAGLIKSRMIMIVLQEMQAS